MRHRLRYIARKVFKAVMWPFRQLADALVSPWINRKTIEEVRIQVEFWHKVESDALRRAIQWENHGDKKRAEECLEQARTARLRCNKEMARLPYRITTNPKPDERPSKTPH